MKASRFYITFLRHGESTGNAENRYQGQADFPLSALGRAQARSLAARWQDESWTYDTIVTSPLLRATETAEIIGAALNVPVERDPLWMERHNGKMQGLKQEEIAQLFPETGVFINPYAPHAETGEGDFELFLRAGRALHRLLQRPPGRYLVVSHGGTLNQTMNALIGVAPQPNFQGARFRFDNTGFTVTTYDPDSHTWRIYKANDHAHIINVNADEITDI